MRTALEILARRQARRASTGLLGYRWAPPLVDERWQTILVFAKYMHPNGPEEEMLETAHALAGPAA